MFVFVKKKVYMRKWRSLLLHLLFLGGAAPLVLLLSAGHCSEHWSSLQRVNTWWRERERERSILHPSEDQKPPATSHWLTDWWRWRWRWRWGWRCIWKFSSGATLQCVMRLCVFPAGGVCGVLRCDVMRVAANRFYSSSSPLIERRPPSLQHQLVCSFKAPRAVIMV